MKKHAFKIVFTSICLFSIFSFVYLNTGGEPIATPRLLSDFPSFNVSSSYLPDVEAVKNTIIFMKEIITFDL